jgi:hypothetical protein
MLPEYHWTQLALPARHFSWRLRGNGLSFAFEETEILDGDYDLLIATSMVDLSTLRGFHPALANLPTLVYFMKISSPIRSEILSVRMQRHRSSHSMPRCAPTRSPLTATTTGTAS